MYTEWRDVRQAKRHFIQINVPFRDEAGGGGGREGSIYEHFFRFSIDLY